MGRLIMGMKVLARWNVECNLVYGEVKLLDSGGGPRDIYQSGARGIPAQKLQVERERFTLPATFPAAE